MLFCFPVSQILLKVTQRGSDLDVKSCSLISQGLRFYVLHYFAIAGGRQSEVVCSNSTRGTCGTAVMNLRSASITLLSHMLCVAFLHFSYEKKLFPDIRLSFVNVSVWQLPITVISITLELNEEHQINKENAS